jgi:hypothetical protein
MAFLKSASTDDIARVIGGMEYRLLRTSHRFKFKPTGRDLNGAFVLSANRCGGGALRWNIQATIIDFLSDE